MFSCSRRLPRNGAGLVRYRAPTLAWCVPRRSPHALSRPPFAPPPSLPRRNDVGQIWSAPQLLHAATATATDDSLLKESDARRVMFNFVRDFRVGTLHIYRCALVRVACAFFVHGRGARRSRARQTHDPLPHLHRLPAYKRVSLFAASPLRAQGKAVRKRCTGPLPPRGRPRARARVLRAAARLRDEAACKVPRAHGEWDV